MKRLIFCVFIFVFAFSGIFAQEAEDNSETANRLRELTEAPDDEVRAAVLSGELEKLLRQAYFDMFGDESYFLETNRLRDLTVAPEEEVRAAVQSGEMEALLRQAYYDLFGKEFVYDEYVSDSELASYNEDDADNEFVALDENYDEDDEYFDDEYFEALFAASSGASGTPVPGHITNNQYFLESVRNANLAQAAFEEGDYDAAIRYSDESVRYANLSDEYVALQLKIMEANGAIATAKERLDWASSSAVNAQTRFPDEYNRAKVSYETAVNYRQGEFWDNAITFAYDVINALAYTYEIGGTPPLRPAPLPAQYTVRTWESSGDCLWNIAGRPWAYGDSSKWTLLYDANRSKFTTPDNPNLIEPGMVLEIPSASGETRQGMWGPGFAYPPLN